MARIAFILLCHKDPEAIIAQAERLSAKGDYVAIHFDGRSPDESFFAIKEAAGGNPNIVLAPRRVKCGWGEWSLVEATLITVAEAETAFPDATHFYMVSGDCMPIKSAAYAHSFLDSRNVDYVESVDFLTSGWIKTGMKEDRLYYRHFFNERRQKTMFYATLEVQRWLRWSRRPPADLQIMIGSQWWCLRRSTIEAILDFCRERRDVIRFFETTWIPDETFFQTLVRHLVPETEIESRTPTFLMFSDYGMPTAFYNDHYDLLLGQDYLFARKISDGALELKERLGALWENDEAEFEISGEGHRLHKFLTSQGRIGRRFAPRFWETEGSLGRERELLLVACKKWHVAKRMLGVSNAVIGITGVEYIFNEADAQLPDLGGLEKSLDKRTRHRRAMLRMLFDYYQTDKLAVCLDPSAVDLMRDFFSDKARVRMLEINCEFSDDYLTGHAERVGLAAGTSASSTIDSLLPTIRAEIAFEREQIRDAKFDPVYRITQGDSAEDNAAQLAAFFQIPWDRAMEIASTPYLFDD